MCLAYCTLVKLPTQAELGVMIDISKALGDTDAERRKLLRQALRAYAEGKGVEDWLGGAPEPPTKPRCPSCPHPQDEHDYESSGMRTCKVEGCDCLAMPLGVSPTSAAEVLRTATPEDNVATELSDCICGHTWTDHSGPRSLGSCMQVAGTGIGYCSCRRYQPDTDPEDMELPLVTGPLVGKKLSELGLAELHQLSAAYAVLGDPTKDLVDAWLRRHDQTQRRAWAQARSEP